MTEIYTVSQITFAVKKQLESSFQGLQVRGEITNLKYQSSGHVYFTLKDANAQISAVLFQNYAKALARPLKDGDRIIIEGELSVYVPRGTYQLVAKRVTFDGVGDLLMELHRLKEELKEKGYFDPGRKKPLPLFPKTIGVVTSPTGAVIQDILHILDRRFSGFHLILNPVKVQGEGAAREIALAIDAFNQFGLADVVIVCRGGGSLEDLWAFNEKEVADAIFRSKIPIISAVGHETDFSISDFVADVRAPTPSAAAELVLQEKKGLKKTLSTLQTHISSTLHQSIKQQRFRLDRFRHHPKMTDPYSLLGTFEQKLDEIESDLENAFYEILEKLRAHLLNKRELLKKLLPTRQMEQDRKELSSFHKRLSLAVKAQLDQKASELKHLQTHLNAIHPKNVLKKGYCICFEENTHSVIISAKGLDLDKKISLLMHDGSALAKIEGVTYG